MRKKTQYTKSEYNVQLRCVWIFAYWTLLRRSYHSIHGGHILCCSAHTINYYYYISLHKSLFYVCVNFVHVKLTSHK